MIYTKNFVLGDPTISTLELWGAEYQESDAILTQPQDRDFLTKISQREKCAIDFVGVVTGGGCIRLVEESDEQLSLEAASKYASSPDKKLPVDLQLQHVLGSMPNKEFHFKKETPLLRPLSLPLGIKTIDALKRVLRLPSVASKRFLTNKVDRSVTGKK